MALEKRGCRLLYYRSVRRNGVPRRIYVGSGDVARIAAEIDASQRAGRRAQLASGHTERAHLLTAQVLAAKLHAACVLLMTTTLLAAGFHRAERHSWRRWHAGHRTVKNAS